MTSRTAGGRGGLRDGRRASVPDAVRARLVAQPRLVLRHIARRAVPGGAAVPSPPRLAHCGDNDSASFVLL